MSDVIRLLPENIANQIAAGEVIQRPSSVVKELIENSVDAGASQIQVIIKDSGRTLIQVIDNGCGMSITDARMAFERHATSKITDADDLFRIKTMGFRGEALASIAAVAEVILQTRRECDEIGTELIISESNTISQEFVACHKGANFSVKNLFFNVPARRKFLKSDAYELKLIMHEIQKIALTFPKMEISLQHNDRELFHYYPIQHLRQRIAQVAGKHVASTLIEVKSETILAKINGWIGNPDSAKKSQSEQYFFVNNRYMRHSLFHKAIIQGYEKILPEGVQPAYFIYFEVDPQKIDVNIHPTKTEIKFEDEQALWQILHSAVRQALGKYNIVPSLDFDTEPAIPIPPISSNTPIRIPAIQINPNYNPFETSKTFTNAKQNKDLVPNINNLPYWETLFENTRHSQIITSTLPLETETSEKIENKFLQLKGKYILTQSKSGLMIIDQKRAHERILFEEYVKIYQQANPACQKLLYPELINLSAADFVLIESLQQLIEKAGFEIRYLKDNTLEIIGYPSFIKSTDIKEVITKIIENFQHFSSEANSSSIIEEYLAKILSKVNATPYGKLLSNQEMQYIIDKLFACSNHNYTPEGKTIIVIISLSEFENMFD